MQSANFERLVQAMERRGLRIEIADENEVARNIGFFDSLFATTLTYSYGDEGGELMDEPTEVQMSIAFAGHKLERVKRRPTEREATEKAVDRFFDLVRNGPPSGRERKRID